MRESDLLRLLPPPIDPCPTADTLAALASGELAGDDRLRVVDHLTACAACADDYRLASTLGPWSDRAHAATAATKDRAPTATIWWSLAAAAAVVAAVGLGAWAIQLRGVVAELSNRISHRPTVEALDAANLQRQEAEMQVARLEQDLAALRQPDLNSPIVDLLPGVTRNGTPQQAVVRVPDTARFVTLVFTVDGPAPPDALTLAIDAQGTTIGRWPGLRAGRFATATAVVPAALIPPGAYRVRLLSASTVVQEYRLTVESAGGRTP